MCDCHEMKIKFLYVFHNVLFANHSQLLYHFSQHYLVNSINNQLLCLVYFITLQLVFISSNNNKIDYTTKFCPKNKKAVY